MELQILAMQLAAIKRYPETEIKKHNEETSWLFSIVDKYISVMYKLLLDEHINSVFII
jgi:hypothetical protein